MERGEGGISNKREEMRKEGMRKGDDGISKRGRKEGRRNADVDSPLPSISVP